MHPGAGARSRRRVKFALDEDEEESWRTGPENGPEPLDANGLLLRACRAPARGLGAGPDVGRERPLDLAAARQRGVKLGFSAHRDLRSHNSTTAGVMSNRMSPALL